LILDDDAVEHERLAVGAEGLVRKPESKSVPSGALNPNSVALRSPV
jgi:hypothetical protein